MIDRLASFRPTVTRFASAQQPPQGEGEAKTDQAGKVVPAPQAVVPVSFAVVPTPADTVERPTLETLATQFRGLMQKPGITDLDRTPMAKRLAETVLSRGDLSASELLQAIIGPADRQQAERKRIVALALQTLMASQKKAPLAEPQALEQLTLRLCQDSDAYVKGTAVVAAKDILDPTVRDQAIYATLRALDPKNQPLRPEQKGVVPQEFIPAGAMQDFVALGAAKAIRSLSDANPSEKARWTDYLQNHTNIYVALHAGGSLRARYARQEAAERAADAAFAADLKADK